jgi:TniQ
MTGPTIRPLPSRPWPLNSDGPEAFAGYVERSGALQLLPLSVTTLLTRSGVIAEDLQSALPSGYGVDLTDAQVTSFARTHTLPEGAVRGMLLRRYDGVAFDLTGLDVTDPKSVRRVASREWASFTGSAYCPACLGDRAVWNLEWKLWFSAVCPRHGCLLVDLCPSCARRPGNFRDETGGMPLYATRPVRPGVCLNPPATGLGGEGRLAAPCGHVLSTTPVLDISGSQRLSRMQEGVLSVLRMGEGTLLGQPVPALTYFNHLRSLVALLMHVAQPDDLGVLSAPVLAAFAEHAHERDLTRVRERGRGTSIHPYKAPPKSLRLTAAVLPLATELLESDTPDALSTLLAPVLSRAQDLKGSQVRQLVAYFHIQGPLQDAFERSLEGKLSFDRRLGQRALGSGFYTYGFSPAEVPQLLWKEEYEAQFSQFFSGSRMESSYARRVCSMALVRLCGPYTWVQAADALSLPASHATGSANSAMGLLAAGGHDAAFRDALHSLAERLSRQPSRVDYRGRRERLAGLMTLSRGDWQVVAKGAGIEGVKDTARRRSAAAWIWAQVTGGDPRLSPALNTGEGNRRSRMEMYRRFETHDLPVFRRELDALARGGRYDASGRH